VYPRSSIITGDPAFIPFPAQGVLTADNLPNAQLTGLFPNRLLAA